MASKRQRLANIAYESQVQKLREATRGRLWEEGTSAYIQLYRQLLDVRPDGDTDDQLMPLVARLETLRASGMPLHTLPTPMPPVVTSFHRYHLLHQRTKITTSLLHATELLAKRAAFDDELRTRIAGYTPPAVDKLAIVLVTSHGSIGVTAENQPDTVVLPWDMHVLRVTPAMPGQKSYLSNQNVLTLLKLADHMYKLAARTPGLLNMFALYYLILPYLQKMEDDIQAKIETPADYTVNYSGMYAMLYGQEHSHTMFNKSFSRTKSDLARGDQSHVILINDRGRVERIMPTTGAQTVSTQHIVDTLKLKGYTSSLFLDFSCNTSDGLWTTDDFDEEQVDIVSTSQELHALAQAQVQEESKTKFLLGGS